MERNIVVDYYEAFESLRKYYLGDYYISDSVTTYQGNKILVKEIINKYPKDCYLKIFYLNIIALVFNIYMLCFVLGKI